jgi:hypothetical protein
MPNQKWEIHSVLSTQCPENLFLDYPVIISVNQSRVEYTSLELRQIALEQIRVLPARLEVLKVTEAVTDLLHPILTAQGSPSSANTLPSIVGQIFHYHDHPGKCPV